MSKYLSTEAVCGLTDLPVDALRYASENLDPMESTHAILQFVRHGSKVLDVGCGTGTISNSLRTLRNADVVGLEPNPDRATAARARGFRVVESPLEEIDPQEHGKFDVILFADVLEHLEDPCKTLAHARGLLAPNGAIIASIPNVAHWTVRLNLLRGRFDYEPTGIMDATHLRWFTAASIARLFAGAGYTVRDMRFSAGAWMNAYERFPFSLAPRGSRARLLGILVNRWPGLFACQFIVRAPLR